MIPDLYTPSRYGKYYSNVYFRHESEPYMTLALSPRRDSGVTIAEVNLKFIKDVLAQIKVGEHGQAYVIDADNRLIAHPDINLVLRGSNLSNLPQVQTARGATGKRARGIVASRGKFGWDARPDGPRPSSSARLGSICRNATSGSIRPAVRHSPTDMVAPFRGIGDGGARGALPRATNGRTNQSASGRSRSHWPRRSQPAHFSQNG